MKCIKDVCGVSANYLCLSFAQNCAKMKSVFIVCLIVAISGYAKSENESFDDSSEDNSVFDKILSINQKAARSRSGGQQPKLFEGDIVVTENVKEMISGGRGRGAATNNRYHIWPEGNSGKHEVPYVIDRGLYRYTQKIMGAMREWEEKVPCIKFVRRTNQRGYLHYHSGSGCSSAVGHQGRRQYVSLQSGGCTHHGIIVHEIGHAMGFWHEQSRHDRDNYITIYWNNITPNMRFNFDKMSGKTDERGVGYDYGSIMHYGPKAFSSNGRVTIAAKGGQSIGQRQGLSSKDVEQARKMYGCSGTGGGTTGGGTTGGGTTGGGSSGCKNMNSNCENWAVQGYCNKPKNRKWMLSNCKEACCSKNQHERCKEWQVRGECSKNPRYMLRNCRASCNECSC